MHRLKAILDYSQEGIESVGPWWGSGVRESCSGRFYGFALLSMVLLVLGSGGCFYLRNSEWCAWHWSRDASPLSEGSLCEGEERSHQCRVNRARISVRLPTPSFRIIR